MVRGLALCCALVVTAPGTAAAEWHFTPTVGLTFSGNTNIVDLEDGSRRPHKQVGGTVTLVGGGLFGVEAVSVYTPGFFSARRPRPRTE